MGTRNHRTLHIGVLLGDPRLPYPYVPDGRFGREEIDAVTELRTALGQLEGYRFTYFDDHGRLLRDLGNQHLDMALNLCDSGYRNNWTYRRNIPALLEILDIPYTGADAYAISLGADKALVNAAARMLDIAVPNETFVDLTADPLVLPTTYPALIKPNDSGGSFGITADSVVDDAAQAEAYLRWLAPQIETPEALIQDYITGEEYTIGLIGNPDSGFTVLPPLAIDYSQLDPALPRILTHDSKATPESPYWQKLTFQPAELDEVSRAKLLGDCAKLFRRLGFRDYARFDFRNGADGIPRLLDANTTPTWYADGKMALMASWAGYRYADMLRLILATAAKRYAIRRRA